jgi:hypothetical protein
VGDHPFVDDDAMPYPHHPIRNLPWLDTLVELKMFQLRAGLSYRLAEWTRGKVAVENGEPTTTTPDASRYGSPGSAGLSSSIWSTPAGHAHSREVAPGMVTVTVVPAHTISEAGHV